jgi:hypothetical protein
MFLALVYIFSLGCHFYLVTVHVDDSLLGYCAIVSQKLTDMAEVLTASIIRVYSSP